MYKNKKQTKLNFNRFLMVSDAFKAHVTRDKRAALKINGTSIVTVPPGFTSKCQPLDVCVNKSFKPVKCRKKEKILFPIYRR